MKGLFEESEIPKGLDWKSVSDIVERKKISHHHYEIAWRELLTHISFSNPGDIILLVGMTGTGKSKMAKSMNDLLLNESPDGKIVSVYGIASNSGYQGKFDSKEMIKNLLRSLGHPAFSIDSSLSVAEILETRVRKFTNSQLARLLSTYIHNLGAKYIFIDEAQHLEYAGASHSTIDPVLNYWKAFAEEAGVVLILVASYQVLEIIGESGHLIRRSRIVHLNRYKDNKEIENFAQIVFTYCKFIPGLEDVLKNLPWVDGLRRGCHGSIGLLTKWLGRAISHCHAHELNKLSTDVLDTHQFSPSELETIRREIDIGDKYFFSKKPSYFLSANHPSEAKKNTRKARSKPFEQKPKRFPTQNKSGDRRPHDDD